MRHATTSGPHTAQILAACLMLLLPAVAGCEAVGYFLRSVFPTKIEVVYPLADRPTLVLVDDPSHLFEDITLLDELASQTGFHLVNGKALTASHVVPVTAVQALAASLGNNYDRTPIDSIGRQVQAQQVIHVLIESVRIFEEPGLAHPTAKVQVKVIDAAEDKRLFPNPEAAIDGLTPQNYHSLVITLPYSSIGEDQMGSVRLIHQKLARRIGRDVSQLFYNHPPNRSFDN